MPRKTTIVELTPGFLHWAEFERERAVTPQTLKSYTVRLPLFARAWPGRSVTKITADDIKEFRVAMLKRGCTRSYTQTVLCIFRTFVRYCREELDLKVIDPRDIRLPSRERYEVNYVTPRDLELFLKAIDTDTLQGARMKAFIAVTLETGMRLSETLSLNRDTIDMYDKSAIITGKGRKQRHVFFTDWSLRLIREYLQLRKDECLALFVTHQKPFVESRLPPDGVRRFFRIYSKKAGIPLVMPHKLRRTAGTYWHFQGADIMRIKDFLGHEDIKFTQLYVGTDWKQIQDEHRRLSTYHLLDPVKPAVPLWNRKAKLQACVGCKTTVRKYMGNGRCTACYMAEYRGRKIGYQSKMARAYESRAP